MSRNAGMHADSIPARHPRRRPYCAKDSAQACKHRRDKAKQRRESAPPCHDRRRPHTPCCCPAPTHHCCGVMLPVAACTTIVPVMCGCKEQKYLYVPGVVNVNENLSSESSGFDRTFGIDTTVCGMSSSLTQVTVVPAFTVICCGLKVKLPILTGTSSDLAGEATSAAVTAAARPSRVNDLVMAAQPFSAVSMMASRCSFCLKVTLAMPSIFSNCSVGTFIGPGDGAVPGAGCGNAVERAVWKVTLPSTFCITWWMWPLSTVTEPKRLR